MANLKIQTLASKDDERKALADFRKAILATDPQSYLASLISDGLVEWFNKQVQDDSCTDLAGEREYWAGQAAEWKSKAALAEQHAEDVAAIMASKYEKAAKAAKVEQDDARKALEFKDKCLDLARDSEGRAWNAYYEANQAAGRAVRDYDAVKAELEALKAQVKAQALKAQAALGSLAALVIDDNTAA